MYPDTGAHGNCTPRPSAREIGERAGALQANRDTSWLFVLWLELLAHAGRDGEFRKMAAEFWRGTRALGAAAVSAAYEEAGKTPPADPARIASAFIALDVGLAVQHWARRARRSISIRSCSNCCSRRWRPARRSRSYAPHRP